jgi:hypothetical protein
MVQAHTCVVHAPQVVKLGEGTYGEAFKSGQVVFKLVPMEGNNLINGWPQKGAGDLLGEAVIAITLSGLTEEADAAGELSGRLNDALRVAECDSGWPQKGAADLLGEAVIAITLSGLTEEADAAGELCRRALPCAAECTSVTSSSNPSAPSLTAAHDVHACLQATSTQATRRPLSRRTGWACAEDPTRR